MYAYTHTYMHACIHTYIQTCKNLTQNFSMLLNNTTKKLRRLAIIWDYRVCNITIILGIFCAENKKKLSCIFSLSWVFFFIIVGAFS